jgi:hypothetical protein
MIRWIFVARSMAVCLLGVCLGCGADDAPPPSFTPQHRQTIKQNLAKLGAKVTAEIPEELYLSLRNTHIEVRDLGGIIHGTWQTRRDIQDFGVANEAVAKGFLETGEFESFKQWLHRALSPSASAVHRSEYNRFKVTLSRKPLRMVFTRKLSADEE